MSELSIAVCEDNKNEQINLLKILEKTDYEYKIDIFSSGEEFLNSFYACKYDLIFMDIYMSGMTGVDTVAKIRSIDKHVPIAFITTSLEHTMDGYIYHVNRYLPKPLKEDDVFEVLSLAIYEKKNLPSLHLKSGYSEYEIPYIRIRYIEQSGHNMLLHLTGGREVNINYKISDVLNKLPAPPFLQCHKSYIVNLTHVKFVNKDLLMIEMSEGGTVYVRRNSMKDVEEQYKKYMFESTRNI